MRAARLTGSVMRTTINSRGACAASGGSVVGMRHGGGLGFFQEIEDGGLGES